MDKSDLHRLVDELPEGTEQPAMQLLRHLQGTGGFATPQALAEAIVKDPENRFLLALAATSEDHFLQVLAQDPYSPHARAAALAPFDDEPLTDADREALRVAREEHARGECIPNAELDKHLWQ